MKPCPSAEQLEAFLEERATDSLCQSITHHVASSPAARAPWKN